MVHPEEVSGLTQVDRQSEPSLACLVVVGEKDEEECGCKVGCEVDEPLMEVGITALE